MKDILVTGAAGFIGSNFVNRFSGKNPGQRFIILDALTYAGHLPNIAPALDAGAQFVEGDVRDKKLLDELFARYEFSGVINFAAESHVDRSIWGPDIFLETNVHGTLNLLNCTLRAFKRTGAIRFLQISTDEVYGSLSADEPPFTESNQIKPSSPYSASKAAADHFVQAYHTTYGLPTLITRCSNNYGPMQNREKLIPLMITRALRDERLPVYGAGANIRDWIHVDDHNDGVWEVFARGAYGKVYNLGGASERNNLQIVKLILRALGKSESLIEFVADRPGHDFRYAIDFSKTSAELGWRPKIGFEEGLAQTIRWYLANSQWRP